MSLSFFLRAPLSLRIFLLHQTRTNFPGIFNYQLRSVSLPPSLYTNLRKTAISQKCYTCAKLEYRSIQFFFYSPSFFSISGYTNIRRLTNRDHWLSLCSSLRVNIRLCLGLRLVRVPSSLLLSVGIYCIEAHIYTQARTNRPDCHRFSIRTRYI